ncbi:hypothetical protein MN116_004226 [Schistosoma mekongi]|uniref:Cathepsin B-like cysteine proteinase n=1 Tax=Schistosoma mekongi TaxID=38744 RepID=A0AAE1ZGR7_SCHME|nr:hypothetical protein MN116_004226 [Schistosoma mekongi]
MHISILPTYLLLYFNAYNSQQWDALSDEQIYFINNHSSSGWKASKHNRFTAISGVYNTLEYYGVKQFKRRILPIISHDDNNILLPDYFDSREQWGDCPSIKRIYDQSQCYSSWAVASVAAMSDRICTQTNGTVKVELSAIELVSCCSKCGPGCNFGFSEAAWYYWVRNGLVTGESNGNSSGCLPYPFPKCDHGSSDSYPKCGYVVYTPPVCNKTCRPGYSIPYINDKHFGKSAYQVKGNESDIRKEIMLYGPVEASIFIHADFVYYKSGVYRHLTGRLITIHSVRIIGWGIENDIPYWLCANSWNEEWGLNGYFKILRGSNECEIEAFVNAGRVNMK